MFSAVAHPSSFVQTYFVQHRDVRDMPTWLSDAGGKLKDALDRIRSDFEGLRIPDRHRRSLLSAIDVMALDAGSGVIRSAAGDAAEFGIGSELVHRFAADQALGARLPSWNVITAVVAPLTRNSLGLQDGGNRPERSAAGDIMHTLYLPHADLLAR
jgi:hypothetical protein